MHLGILTAQSSNITNFCTRLTGDTTQTEAEKTSLNKSNANEHYFSPDLQVPLLLEICSQKKFIFVQTASVNPIYVASIVIFLTNGGSQIIPKQSDYP